MYACGPQQFGAAPPPHAPPPLPMPAQMEVASFLEALTLRLSQAGPAGGAGTQQDCISKLRSLELGDDFWMFMFKVVPCNKGYAHKWTLCPCAHAGETARRRDPRTHNYKAVLCPLVKAKKTCPLGDSCGYSHNVFEHWLHPSRYKTRLCSFGRSCNRSICFFAHDDYELRVPPEESKELDERDYLLQLMVAQEKGQQALLAQAQAQNGGGHHAHHAPQYAPPHPPPHALQHMLAAQQHHHHHQQQHPSMSPPLPVGPMAGSGASTSSNGSHPGAPSHLAPPQPHSPVGHGRLSAGGAPHALGAGGHEHHHMGHEHHHMGATGHLAAAPDALLLGLNQALAGLGLGGPQDGAGGARPHPAALRHNSHHRPVRLSGSFHHASPHGPQQPASGPHHSRLGHRTSDPGMRHTMSLYAPHGHAAHPLGMGADEHVPPGHSQSSPLPGNSPVVPLFAPEPAGLQAGLQAGRGGEGGGGGLADLSDLLPLMGLAAQQAQAQAAQQQHVAAAMAAAAAAAAAGSPVASSPHGPASHGSTPSQRCSSPGTREPGNGAAQRLQAAQQAHAAQQHVAAAMAAGGPAGGEQLQALLGSALAADDGAYVQKVMAELQARSGGGPGSKEQLVSALSSLLTQLLQSE